MTISSRTGSNSAVTCNLIPTREVGRDRPVAPFPFACGAFVGLYGQLVGLFGLGSVAWTKSRMLGTAIGQQAWQSERAELEARLLVVELLVAERCGLATAHLDSLAPSFEDPGTNPAA